MLAAVLLTSACGAQTRDLPDEEAFVQGPCRTAAPSVLALDEQARSATDGDVDTRQLLTALQADQERLGALVEEADAIAQELTEVVTRVGFLRAALATDSLEQAEVDDVTAAVDGLVAVCVPAK